MPPVARATPPTDRSARAIAIIPMLLNHLFLYLVAAVRGRRPATPLIAVRGMRASLEGEELAIDDARNGPGTSHRRPAGGATQIASMALRGLGQPSRDQRSRRPASIRGRARKRTEACRSSMERSGTADR